MQHRIIVAFSILGASILAGCNQSPGPAVVATPAVATEEKAEVAVRNADEEKVVKVEVIPDGGTFPFPDDLGGKAVAKTLTPAIPAAMSAATPTGPKPRLLPEFLDAPTTPLPDSASSPPRLPLPATKESRPTPLPNRVPTDLGGTSALAPVRDELPTGPLTQATGRDVNLPAGLPILSAKPVADRAPLTDPTIEFTALSVISPMLPLRMDPTGFVRINLPDPFEHADAAKPRTPVVEDANKSLTNVPLPK